MIDNENRIQKLEALHLSAEALEKKCKRQWQEHIHIRADKIKGQLLLEDRFQKAILEMHTTTDRSRQSYLLWILHHNTIF